MIAAGFGLALGMGIAVALGGFTIFTGERAAESVSAGPATAEPAASPPAPASTGSPTDASSVAAPTLLPLEVGGKKGKDLEDVLLLYDSNHVSNFDINFCKIAEYYGLLCKRVAVDSTDLTDELLRDDQGNYFELVGISADTLLASPPLLTDGEIATIKSSVETGGMGLLISKVHGGSYSAVLAGLTDGAVLGVTKPQDSNRDWIISSAAPEITREFTGQVISSDSTEPQGDFALILGPQDAVTTLTASTDDAGADYPILVRWEGGTGSIFIDAGEQGESLEDLQLREMYYNTYNFAKIVPLMFIIRHAMGDEAWHNDHDYANLTIDDPTLIEPFHDLSFVELLQEMQASNFHTTIAMHPVDWDRSEPEVVALFLANPDRYSLVQHGNNGDGYEFYKYSVSEDDEYEARPLVDQERDIVEGLSRMEMHRSSTDVPYDKVMVFPWGISPEPTLVLLKKYNFLATVNGQHVPLDATRPSDWDYGMYQANMDYGNFPMLSRRHPGTYLPFEPVLQPFIFDLFIDKPALFYSHAYEGALFETGIDAFNPVARQINSLSGEVEWHSLGYIIRHLYLEKVNDDGSIDVKMYANHLIVTNESGDERTYHIAKEETLNVPVSSLTVNGHEFPYRIEEGLLTLDVRVPAGSSVEILIRYGD